MYIIQMLWHFCFIFHFRWIPIVDAVAKVSIRVTFARPNSAFRQPNQHWTASSRYKAKGYFVHFVDICMIQDNCIFVVKASLFQVLLDFKPQYLQTLTEPKYLFRYWNSFQLHIRSRRNQTYSGSRPNSLVHFAKWQEEAELWTKGQLQEKKNQNWRVSRLSSLYQICSRQVPVCTESSRL